MGLTDQIKYPEHKKYDDVESEIAVIMEFLESFQAKHQVEYMRSTQDGYVDIPLRDMEKYVLAFFGIDAEKMEEERKKISAEYRALLGGGCLSA